MEGGRADRFAHDGDTGDAEKRHGGLKGVRVAAAYGPVRAEDAVQIAGGVASGLIISQ
jgi:hypothetical protein